MTLGCPIFELFRKEIILLFLIVDILFRYVVMCGYLGSDVQITLIELGVFFRELCYRKLKINLLEKFKKDIVLILYKLKKKFSPSFFDVMVYLTIHLSKKALLTRLVYYL